uniref:Uncharacterized protein n=1 Tax=Knipowitschia caucasica TaxID=637954 RepID=A0AAV2LEH5_KNICA
MGGSVGGGRVSCAGGQRDFGGLYEQRGLRDYCGEYGEPEDLSVAVCSWVGWGGIGLGGRGGGIVVRQPQKRREVGKGAGGSDISGGEGDWIWGLGRAGGLGRRVSWGKSLRGGLWGGLQGMRRKDFMTIEWGGGGVGLKRRGLRDGQDGEGILQREVVD